MEVIILAGGFGTRLKSVVPDLPKPMANVAGKPFLEILLNSLIKKGAKRIILSVGYMANKIIDYFGNDFAGIEIIYEIENSPLGTGGAIYNALKKCTSDHVLVLNGDTFFDIDILLAEFTWQKNYTPLIFGCLVSDTSRYGRLDIDKNNRIIGFKEKGESGSGLINAGGYLLPVNIFGEKLIEMPFSFENDFLVKILNVIKFEALIVSGKFIDIGIPDDYARAQLEF
jgi:D-glycero-alpha-D-manno-heptose 1-phosphate guanylyltransferase